MSGRGEEPEADGDEQAKRDAESVALGENVYNEDGAVLGTVRGYERGGFFASTRDRMEQLSIEHARSGHDFGEAHPMWRCMNSGEMAQIDAGLPEQCPRPRHRKGGTHVENRRLSDATRATVGATNHGF